MGFASAVSAGAVKARFHSVAPPLPDEAYASPGLWERRSPLENLPDGQGRNPAGFPPLDPPSEEREMVCHNLTQGRPVPWLPLGLRSRGAVVNDMLVACQSRA